MTDKQHPPLRIWRDDTDQTPSAEPWPAESLGQFAEAFRQLTGYRLRWESEAAGAGRTDRAAPAVSPPAAVPPGRLELDLNHPADTLPQREPPQAVIDLTEAASQLVAGLLRSQHMLRAREAELATAVPVVARPEEASLLAERLEAVLRSGARAVDCDAAGLYLLDEATTVLKLRAAWGLPPDRLGQPPRRLSGALADLEAMLGHAVVLEDQRLAPYWNPPEEFTAAVCLPVVSASQILGTLWVFSRTERPFSDAQVDVLETVAGRLAAELERRTLLREVAAARRGRTIWAAVRQFLQERQPKKMLDAGRWDVAWHIDQAEHQAGTFCQWVLRPDDTIVLLAGAAIHDGIPGAVALHGLRMAACSYAKTATNPAELIEGTNRTVWEVSPGDELASLFCAFLDPESAHLSWAAAGRAETARIHPTKRGKSSGKPEFFSAAPAIGLDEELSVPVYEATVDPSDALLVRVSSPEWPQPNGSRKPPRGRGKPVAWFPRTFSGSGSAGQLLAELTARSVRHDANPTPAAWVALRADGPHGRDGAKSV